MNMAVSEKAVGTKRNAQSAGNGARKSAASQKTAAKHPASAGKKASGQRGNAGNRNIKTSSARGGSSLDEMNAYRDHQAFEVGITIFVLLLVSVFLYLSCLGLAGNVGIVIGGLFFGVFGWFGWLLPLFTLFGYIFYAVNRGDKRVPRRIFSFAGIALTLLGLSDQIFEKQIITEYYTSNHVLHRGYFDCMFLTCKNVMSGGKFNGGLLGRAIGSVFSQFLGKVGAVVILFVLLLLCLYIFYGVEMMGIIRKRNAYHQEMQEMYEEVRKEEDYREPSYRVFSGSAREKVPDGGRRHFTPRPMEKVPRVQTFDLTKMGGEPEKKPQKAEVPSHTVPLQKEMPAPDAVPTDIPQFQNTVFEEPHSEEMSTDSGVDVSLQEQIATMEDASGENTDMDLDQEAISPKHEIEAIPIYRNELDEKFGKRRKTAGAKVVSFASAAEKKVVDTVHGNQLEADFPESVYDNGEVNLASEPAIEPDLDKTVEPVLKEESGQIVNVSPGLEEEPEVSENRVVERDTVAEPVEIPEDVPNIELSQTIEPEQNLLDSERYAESMQRADQKPMASFAPKEEVTDVTPSSQKVVVKQSASHGKIGGDNYVSASNTFNALNESKVAVEKEVPYEFPSVGLLRFPEGGTGSVSDEELRQTALKLQDTLKSFNVNVKMGAVTCGPTVTRYEILPEQGVRVNKITNLADDLKLSLAAASIRIEAPIPGKAAVGIEVPNPVPSSVSFRELLEGDSFTKSKSSLTFAVGKDIGGKLIMADIGKMPHLLIAGATGSGKSVCINTLIMSILYKADPKDVKLIMIDPKVVELSVYNGIPHLFCPVVTDPKEAAAALNWAVREMMDRYNKFKELGVRNIAGYNEKIQTVENAEAAGYARMPYLVVIVDEFADLMMVASKEVEDAVCRLAQLARAAGIHLVLATQRPSVNVITGVIKANIPSRIAFSVSSAIDSRTILDKGGAEKLLGKGDMLFFPSGYSEPVRVQGAFVSDKEVSDVVEFLCSNNETPEYDHSVTQILDEPKEEEQPEKKPQDDRDDYFADAGRFVIESDRAAAGQLQRKFSIGFNRAGRIIDQLNKAGVVGPAEGTKPRKVLMTMEQFEQMLSGGSPAEDEVEAMVQAMEMEAVSTEEMF